MKGLAQADCLDVQVSFLLALIQRGNLAGQFVSVTPCGGGVIFGSAAGEE